MMLASGYSRSVCRHYYARRKVGLREWLTSSTTRAGDGQRLVGIPPLMHEVREVVERLRRKDREVKSGRWFVSDQ
jgi:Cys-tRNA synthase (O-phospho-L-seryl-tRNA:Cys-tRNA synthase)